MAIDPNIARGITPIGAGLPQFMMQLQDQRAQQQQASNQNQLAQLQIGGLRQAQERDAAARMAYQNSDLPGLMAANPEAGAAVREHVGKWAAGALDTLDQAKADPAAFAQARQGLAQAPEFAWLKVSPGEITPEAIPSLRARLGQAGKERKVKYINAGGQQVPVDETTGQPVQGLAPITDTVSANTKYTQGQENYRAGLARKEQKPQLVDVTNPDGTVGKQWVIPGAASGTPVGAATLPSDKKTTDTERAAAGYLERMNNAEPLIATYQPSAKDFYAASKIMSGGPGAAMVANKFMSKEGQQYYQAASDWVRAKLRKESGAVIGPQEMEQEIRTYFPLPNDDAATIAQKAASRATATRAMIDMAGPAARKAGASSVGTPSASRNRPPIASFNKPK